MSTPRPFEVLAIAAFCLGTTRASPAAASPEDETSSGSAMAQYRERFKQGLDRYDQGAFAEAVGYWEPIYRELGEHDGYRLAYNLGVAYMQLGDATRAAERMQTFLGQCAERREKGEKAAPVVVKEETDARARMAELIATKGRIRIDASTPAPAVKVDAADPRLAGFVAWVTPGSHTVIFAPGTPQEETQTVVVQASEMVTSAPAPPPAPATPPASSEAIAPSPERQQTVPAPAPTPSPLATSPTPSRAWRPPLSVVLTSGGVTVAATVAAVVLEVHAQELDHRYVAEWSASPTHTVAAADRHSYDVARTEAYVAVGSAAGLAAVTAALVTLSVTGSPRRDRPAVGLSVGPGEAVFRVRGTF